MRRKCQWQASLTRQIRLVEAVGQRSPPTSDSGLERCQQHPPTADNSALGERQLEQAHINIPQKQVLMILQCVPNVSCVHRRASKKRTCSVPRGHGRRTRHRSGQRACRGQHQRHYYNLWDVKDSDTARIMHVHPCHACIRRFMSMHVVYRHASTLVYSIRKTLLQHIRKGEETGKSFR